MRILERLAILSAMALCVLAGEVAADGPVSFDREFVYEEGQTIAQAYRTWRFDIDEAGVYALDIVPGTRPVTAFLDGAQIAFTRAGNDNKGKIDKEGRIRRTRWLAPGSHVFDLHVTIGHAHNDKMEEAMRGNEKVPGVRAGVSKLREGEAGFWIEGRDPDCMERVAGEPLVVAGCAANGIVFVGNFSGKPVTVGVESVAADKARVLLANGAVIFGASFRLAPWGFAFLEEK